MYIAILYGLAEGTRHGKSMAQALKARGHELSPPDQADIIIAHSGGCLLDNRREIPHLWIDPPLALDQPFGKNILSHVIYDMRHVLTTSPSWYLTKTAWNILYLSIGIPRTIHMYRSAKHKKTLTIPDHTTVVLTADTSWRGLCEVEDAVTWDVDHDDCWRHPTAYLDLMRL